MRRTHEDARMFMPAQGRPANALQFGVVETRYVYHRAHGVRPVAPIATSASARR